MPDDINARVAEEVMGIKPRTIRLRGSTETCTVWSNNPFFQDGVLDDCDAEAYGLPPNYSTDISAAWEVVRRVLSIRPHPNGGMTDVSVKWNPYKCVWVCTFNWSDDKPVTAEHVEIGIAICQAALLAVAAKGGK